MKRNLIFAISLLVILLAIGAYFILKKETNEACNIEIKSIPVATKIDTVSYALGYAWAINMSKYGGLNNITYAFYNGVQDYIKGDTSFMGIYKASDYLKEKLDKIKLEKWPVNDSTMSLCDIEVESKFDTFSYALGFAWCRGAYGIGISQVSPALISGLLNTFKGDTSIFKNYVSANNYLLAYVDELRLAKFGDIKAKNDNWLAENAKKEGVITLPSGIQYKIIKSVKGNVKPINNNDIIECMYTGKLIDGSVYENYNNASYKFYLFAEIKGLSEVVQLMKPGEKWEIYLPYNLAYGSGGINEKVPPFSTVIIEFELLNITKK
jgi:FKBP-type peptidyl-prolyl cis-trans isomerase